MAAPDPTVHFAIRAPLTRADLPGLSARVCRTLERERPGVVVCDLGSLDHVDAVTVDALARLQLAARRRGCRFHLAPPSAEIAGELERLVSLMGLDGVVVAEPREPV